jgi:hypothetical protein
MGALICGVYGVSLPFFLKAAFLECMHVKNVLSMGEATQTGSSFIYIMFFLCLPPLLWTMQGYCDETTQKCIGAILPV